MDNTMSIRKGLVEKSLGCLLKCNSIFMQNSSVTDPQ